MKKEPLTPCDPGWTFRGVALMFMSVGGAAAAVTLTLAVAETEWSGRGHLAAFAWIALSAGAVFGWLSAPGRVRDEEGDQEVRWYPCTVVAKLPHYPAPWKPMCEAPRDGTPFVALLPPAEDGMPPLPVSCRWEVRMTREPKFIFNGWSDGLEPFAFALYPPEDKNPTRAQNAAHFGAGG